MKLQAEIGGKAYIVVTEGIDLSIPMHFGGPQPNTYGVPRAVSQAFEGDGWVGDTRRGGSCNFETYTLIPHCNGTHTECVGHISHARIPIRKVLAPGLQPATLISVGTTPSPHTRDSYDPSLDPSDQVVDRLSLERALEGSDPDFHTAIIIRTLPNPPDKRERDYMQHPPAFFSLEAMEFLSGLSLQHLLIDLPSVDRLFDEGKLNAHHIFWGLEAGSHEVDADAPSSRTITEMIYVAERAPDGKYLLDLQIAPFMSDAAPSRPVIYPLIG